MRWRYGGTGGKKECENHRKGSDSDKVDVKEGKDGWKKGEEGGEDISSCCTGSSSPIDVSTACTRALSTSYQHRWAARSVPRQEKIQDNCEALIVLSPPHFSQTLTFSKQSLTTETIPLSGLYEDRTRKTTAINSAWIFISTPQWRLVFIFFFLTSSLCCRISPWANKNYTRHLPWNNSDCSNCFGRGGTLQQLTIWHRKMPSYPPSCCFMSHFVNSLSGKGEQIFPVLCPCFTVRLYP